MRLKRKEPLILLILYLLRDKTTAQESFVSSDFSFNTEQQNMTLRKSESHQTKKLTDAETLKGGKRKTFWDKMIEERRPIPTPNTDIIPIKPSSAPTTKAPVDAKQVPIMTTSEFVVLNSNVTTQEPSAAFTYPPTDSPITVRPTVWPSKFPTISPSNFPSLPLSIQPTAKAQSPTTEATAAIKDQSAISLENTLLPSYGPSQIPSMEPTKLLAMTTSTNNDDVEDLSSASSLIPSDRPSQVPSMEPTKNPPVSTSAMKDLSALSSEKILAREKKKPTMAMPAIKDLNDDISAENTFLKSDIPSLTPSVEPTISRMVEAQAIKDLGEIVSKSPARINRNSTSASNGSGASQEAEISQNPSMEPTYVPSFRPSIQPTSLPTPVPSIKPTTSAPTLSPTESPSDSPSVQPTNFPTTVPTRSPSATPSYSPSSFPTFYPSDFPSVPPTEGPSAGPSGGPTPSPSKAPSDSPSVGPTSSPTSDPNSSPSVSPSHSPISSPSSYPNGFPSARPSRSPSNGPSGVPTLSPSKPPSDSPSAGPTRASAETEALQLPQIWQKRQQLQRPTDQPTNSPAFPTKSPTQPTNLPTALLTASPTLRPSLRPSRLPTNHPTKKLSTSSPSLDRTLKPSNQPAREPSTSSPVSSPTSSPSSNPILRPSRRPTNHPASPSGIPSPVRKTQIPSSHPTAGPISGSTSPPTSGPTKEELSDDQAITTVVEQIELTSTSQEEMNDGNVSIFEEVCQTEFLPSYLPLVYNTSYPDLTCVVQGQKVLDVQSNNRQLQEGQETSTIAILVQVTSKVDLPSDMDFGKIVSTTFTKYAEDFQKLLSKETSFFASELDTNPSPVRSSDDLTESKSGDIPIIIIAAAAVGAAVVAVGLALVAVRSRAGRKQTDLSEMDVYDVDDDDDAAVVFTEDADNWQPRPNSCKSRKSDCSGDRPYLPPTPVGMDNDPAEIVPQSWAEQEDELSATSTKRTIEEDIAYAGDEDDPLGLNQSASVVYRRVKSRQEQEENEDRYNQVSHSNMDRVQRSMSQDSATDDEEEAPTLSSLDTRPASRASRTSRNSRDTRRTHETEESSMLHGLALVGSTTNSMSDAESVQEKRKFFGRKGGGKKKVLTAPSRDPRVPGQYGDNTGATQVGISQFTYDDHNDDSRSRRAAANNNNNEQRNSSTRSPSRNSNNNNNHSRSSSPFVGSALGDISLFDSATESDPSDQHEHTTPKLTNSQRYRKVRYSNSNRS